MNIHFTRAKGKKHRYEVTMMQIAEINKGKTIRTQRMAPNKREEDDGWNKEKICDTKEE